MWIKEYRHTIQSTIRGVFTAFILIFNIGIAFADDPGITKVRLIQLNDSSYVLEADISQTLLWAIKSPVFPERFHFSDFDFENQSGWITLSATLTTSGSPLSSKDEIILPWSRNGVDITAQWEDGTAYRGFFTQTLGGIHIPLSELMPFQKSIAEVFVENFILGLRHLIFRGVHILLIISLVWTLPRFRVMKYLLWYTFGQATALVLSELGLSGFDLLLSDLLLLLLTFMLSYSSINYIKIKYLGPVLFIAAMMHGLSFVHEIGLDGFQPAQRIQAMFAFNLAIDFGHYALTLILVLITSGLKNRLHRRQWVPIAIGSISFFLVLLVFRENIRPGKTRILGLSSSTITNAYSSPATSGFSAGQAQLSTGLMTTPLMIYLSVEPFEVRQEILVHASSAMEILGMDLDYLPSIPVELQSGIKEGLQDSIISNTALIIDNQITIPSEMQTNFVTLNRGGVSTRNNPVDESLDDGIIGISLVYDTESFPDSVLIDWTLFPPSVQSIEASAVDPHGALTIMMNPDENKFLWKSRLAGFKVPDVRAVEFTRPSVPMISLLIWMGILIYVLYLVVSRKPAFIRYWMLALVGIGFACYPFIRFNPDLPFIPEGKPSRERTSIILNDLLKNVYMAFDRRSEEDVYDRLALTVSGDQLADIYLQNRQSMAMENRGGARAKVVEVNVQELFDVDRSENGGLVADVLWAVRGSVNHFGHTHYRQNQYRALVFFNSDKETWKIYHIETIDEKRIY
jgi:hypothetical protein